MDWVLSFDEFAALEQVQTPVLPVSLQLPASTGELVASNAPSVNADALVRNGAKEIRPFEVFLIRPPRTRERGVILTSNDLLEAL